jgi:hypothetical protein
LLENGNPVLGHPGTVKYCEKIIASAHPLCYEAFMHNGGTISVLDEILEPVTNAFSREVAQALVGLKAGEAAQARIADLAAKCNEGRLSPSEEAEYESYVQAVDMISILQAKARVWLARHQAA